MTQKISISITTGHDTGNTLNVNLLGDVPGLDDFLLVTDSHKTSSSRLPSVLLHPIVDGVILDQAQELPHHLVLDGLVGDGDHVADEPPDAVLDPSHGLDQLRLLVDPLPEHLELAHLQQVSQVEDVGDLWLLQNFL